MASGKFSKLKDTTATALRSKRGKDVLLYLLFVCVAFVFWLLLSLESQVQKDFEIPVEVTDIPENATLIGRVPEKFYVTVKAKGSQLLNFMWGKNPAVKLKFDSNITEQGIFSLSRLKIESKLRDYFGQGVQIVSVKPDSIRLPFTTLPGESVALKIEADVQPDLQCIVSGPIRANVDSVRVFGINGVPRTLKFVETEPINLSGLKDSTKIEVNIKSIDGLRIIPDKVTVTIPVEPLIAKRKNVPIEILGLPENVGLLTFPSSVEVSYLVPMSRYTEDYPIKSFVDYNSIDSLSPRAAVTVSSLPDYFKNISVNPDSIEYIIERRNTSK